MTPRHVCFVTTFYPPYGFGGDALAVQSLAQALARHGHTITVIHDTDAHAVLSGRCIKPPTSDIDAFGVRTVMLQTRAPLLSTLLTQQTGRPMLNGGHLKRFLEDEHFDTVVFNNVSLVGGPGVLSYGNGAAKIYVAHEHWLVCPSHVLWRHNRERCDGRECLRCQVAHRRPPQIWRYTGLLERQLAHIDTFVALSEFSRVKHKEFGFSHDMEVLPPLLPGRSPAAHDPSTASPHQRPFFLFVGRLERLKGLDDVVEAFAQGDGPDFVVVGDGTYGDTLRRLARNMPQVRFVGAVQNEDLAPYYRHALALIVPSVGFETFGMTLIEAFSHGLPVVARRLGSFPEIVEQSGAGLLFSTPEELSAAIHTLQHDPARREALGRAGADAFRRHWSESAVVPRYLDLIERACAKRRARAS